VKAAEFARRRQQLMQMVGNDGIAILPAAPVRTRSRDIEYRYRQNSDFYYLTGINEPEAVAVLAPGREKGEYIVFCRERDAKKELWDGARMGTDGAVEAFGADDAFPFEDIDDILPGIIEPRSRVYYTMGMYSDFDARIAEWINSLRSEGNRGVHTPQEFVALDHVLHDMRLYKSRAEISALRKSAKVAVKAHERAMQITKPGMYEYEIEAEFRHEFQRNNGSVSYNPIVGSGKNACVLHYNANDCQVADGELLLIDAGCELDYYASDITRTFPVNGRFSSEQRAVYEIVLEAQLAAIEKTRKGNHFNDPHHAAVAVITRGLKELGLLKGKVSKLIETEAYREFFMHRCGHWIGIDVHDVGDYKVGEQWRLLEPGMVTTVEPGIYISSERHIPKAFRNIGVRIEDDVLVTSNGPDELSKGLAKSVDEIERLMAG